MNLIQKLDPKSKHAPKPKFVQNSKVDPKVDVKRLLKPHSRLRLDLRNKLDPNSKFDPKSKLDSQIDLKRCIKPH